MRENLLRLEHIKERCLRATPGPWTPRDEVFVETGADPPQVVCVTCRNNPGDSHELPAAANAEFIAEARTDVPRLVQEVERLRAALGHIAAHRANDPAESARQALSGPDVSGSDGNRGSPGRGDAGTFHGFPARPRPELVIDLTTIPG